MDFLQQRNHIFRIVDAEAVIVIDQAVVPVRTLHVEVVVIDLRPVDGRFTDGRERFGELGKQALYLVDKGFGRYRSCCSRYP
jgi:hypothetical protein